MSHTVTLLTEETAVETSADALVTAMRGAPSQRPFAPQSLELLANVSRRLLSDPTARRHPDLQALGYWLRPAALTQLHERFLASLPSGTIAVPRGLTFHVPPSNVGTLFAYTWALSLLAGNRNLIRLSNRADSAQDDLVRILLQTLAASTGDAGLRDATRFVRYGHDDEVSSIFSRAADLRILWGGDATVAHFRGLPVNPRGLDLAFPDRFSWAALSAQAVLEADTAERAALAEGLARDLFWFSQLACSSPRLIVWCGAPADCAEAAAILYRAVGHEGNRLIDQTDSGLGLQRRLFLHQAALDLPVTGFETYGALTVATLAPEVDGHALKGDHGGGGVVYDLHLPTLAEADHLVDTRDQTLVHYGFPDDDLQAFVTRLNGRGLDRLVPVGEALSFEPIWDGVDLLAENTRRVVLRNRKRHA